MFFVAWFWAYFDAALYPNDPLQYQRTDLTGGAWPPKGIQTFDPWHLPLLNTLLLLTSGTTVTWAHHALLHNDRRGPTWGPALTIVLGALFTAVQAYEYIYEIGRASCRERVLISVVAVSLKKKTVDD